MKLDVGCSDAPKGDVNVDLRTREVDEFYRLPLQTYRKIKNFVKADAQHLPFRNKIFSESISSHTIEHVENPSLIVNEMKRVTHGMVRILTPFSSAMLIFLGCVYAITNIGSCLIGSEN